MACPVCGATVREEIAPGFWRCLGERIDVVEHGGPGLTNPALGPGVIRRERWVPCLAEYQEGDGLSTPECRCGTFAVGRCADCRRFVCGSCSGMLNGRRLCSEDLARRQAAIRAERAAAEDAALQAEARRQEDKRAQWLAWVAQSRRALDTIADPTERFARGTADLDGLDSMTFLRLLFPESADRIRVERSWGPHRKRRTYWPWDDMDVEAWFLRSVRTPPNEFECYRYKGGIFTPSRRVSYAVHGWEFDHGSTVGHYTNGNPDAPFMGWYHVRILQGGRQTDYDLDGGSTPLRSDRWRRSVSLTQFCRPGLKAPHPRSSDASPYRRQRRRRLHERLATASPLVQEARQPLPAEDERLGPV
jgi:hypothetical protein